MHKAKANNVEAHEFYHHASITTQVSRMSPETQASMSACDLGKVCNIRKRDTMILD